MFIATMSIDHNSNKRFALFTWSSFCSSQMETSSTLRKFAPFQNNCSTMGRPLLHLSHDNFGTNVTKGIFNNLRNDQTFSDIKLMCDDDFTGGPVMIPAHKVILAASSKFFSKLLTGLDQPHLLLYLRGTPHK